MTDLEITKLCAEAMGYDKTDPLGVALVYDPLHDDAQAMAMVKKFKLDCFENLDEEGWIVDAGDGVHTKHIDLNRAICECVAKMQVTK